VAWKPQQEDQHLKLEWSAPMSGLDTTALAPYAQGLVDAENFLIQNQSYIASTWASVPFGDLALSWTNITLIGFGELGFPIAISGATNVLDKFFYVIIDNAGNIAARVSDNIETVSGGDLPGSPLPALGAPVQGTLTWKTINNTTYLSAPGMSQIFQIGPDPTTGDLTFSLLTDFLGCKFLGEFNGRLIAMNVSQFTTVGGVSFAQNFPYQVAWSAAGQQYGIWNPLDLSSNATGAGFNNLPDVEDEITGALFIGPTVYCIRRAGITEITALNSGIQPLNFDHMWASHKGVGTVFPQTIAQYGPKGCFVAKDDIYSLGIDGISTFGGAAKRAIYTDLQAASVIQSSMVALTINGAPELCYVLALQIVNTGASTSIIRTYIYGFSSQQWMRLTLSTAFTANFVYIASLLLSNIITGIADNTSVDGVAIATQVPGQAPLWFYIPLAPSNSAVLGNANQSQLTFPPARIQTFKDVTIDAVGFYAEGTTGTVFQPIVDGIQFTEQTIGTGPDSAKNLYTSYPLNQASLTSLQPALVVEASGTIAFGEISLYGTIGPGRRP
jgi:hypothetical protein